MKKVQSQMKATPSFNVDEKLNDDIIDTLVHSFKSLLPDQARPFITNSLIEEKIVNNQKEIKEFVQRLMDLFLHYRIPPYGFVSRRFTKEELKMIEDMHDYFQ